MSVTDPVTGSVRARTVALLDVGREAGLDAVGVAAVEPFRRTRRDLERRRGEGLAGTMQFTYRNPARSTEPGRILADARSLVVGAMAYSAVVPGRPARDAGRVARYATEDTYARLRVALRSVADRAESYGGRARVVLDDNALVDRETARRAGLGTYGKNANLLVGGHGSWFVLGSVVTDLELETSEVDHHDVCGECTRCLDRCPTGAIVAPGVVDANRCLAWLVQDAGVFPAEHRTALGDRLYGCDVCQEVCPENRRALDVGRGPGDDAWVDLHELLALDDEELLARYGRWYLAQRDPDILRRNALVILGNVGRADDPDTVRTLRRALVHPSAIVRAHAVWAARRMGHDDLLPPDDDPVVVAEHRRDVPARR